MLKHFGHIRQFLIEKSQCRWYNGFSDNRILFSSLTLSLKKKEGKDLEIGNNKTKMINSKQQFCWAMQRIHLISYTISRIHSY